MSLTPDAFAEKMALLFGAKNPNESKLTSRVDKLKEKCSWDSDPILAPSDFFEGAYRRKDEKAIQDIIEEYRNGRDITCLEVGAGTTYGHGNPNFGCPWLARALAKQERLYMIASDIAPSDPNGVKLSNVYRLDFACFFVCPENDLFYFPFTKLYDPNELDEFHEKSGRVSISLFENGRIKSVDASFLESYDKQLPSTCSDTMPTYHLRRSSGCESLANGKLYIRPIADSEMEKKFFNLDYRSDVDFTRLYDHFDKGSIDIILARNLGPVYSSFMEDLENINYVLAPRGIVIASGTIGYSDMYDQLKAVQIVHEKK